jgi:SAM-dependent methyltransferase
MPLSRLLGASWGAWYVRRHYRHEGVSDAGEAAALAHLRPALGDAAVLDLGVGGGRTITLLAPQSASYVAIDASPEMVAFARSRHPGTDVRLLDARDLAGIGDGSQDLVVFSNNGLDALDHPGRLRVLAEIHRVLRPGGLAQLSSFNLDGPSYGVRPSWKRALTLPAGGGPRRLLRWAKQLFDALLGRYFFRRALAHAEVGDGWARWPLAAHEFRFLVHFSRLGATLRELRDAGLEPIAGWTSLGAPLDLAAERSAAEYLQLVARRTGD